MIQLNFPYGATPLDPNEIDGLLPKHIVSLAELNEWEQANILDAEAWISKHRYSFEDVISLNFVKELHHKMFNQTWKWAGSFRKSNKNIGIDWPSISERTKILFDDMEYQIDNNIFPFDEIVAKFHHRLVFIHLFPNGNGRHARLMSDIILKSFNQPRFSWGANLTKSNDSIDIRKKYIDSLRAADKHDYESLIQFVRS